jgi:hypothetical protein
MKTINFFNREKIKDQKKKNKKIAPSFGITSDQTSIKRYIRKYELEQHYIPVEYKE